MALNSRLRSGYVKAGRLVLHDVRGGRGRPPVVFLHGIAQSGVLDWRFVLPTIAQRRQVYAPDLPGFGFSQKPPLRYGVPLFARTVLRYLDARGLKRVVLVGSSMGGRVAIEVAMRHPERVERLILVNSLGFGAARSPLLGVFTVPGVGDLAYTGLAGALLSMDGDRFRRLTGRLGVVQDLLDDSQLDILREVHSDPGAGYSHTRTARSLALHSMENLAPALARARLPMPIRLIWGARDQLFPVSQAIRAQSALPGSKLAIIEGAGHSPELERPETFLEALVPYLTT
ncbi:MAG: alpha/beta fold hydrolase [Candidatus Dormibacteraeota bacterium]|nr:alpha/beta fold hydrolase [Candidatus Dormibacteraeota bacterium]